eukprot:scaffold73313_cov27-Tisochrysis_lutea.AAC.9
MMRAEQANTIASSSFPPLQAKRSRPQRRQRDMRFPATQSVLGAAYVQQPPPPSRGLPIASATNVASAQRRRQVRPPRRRPPPSLPVAAASAASRARNSSSSVQPMLCNTFRDEICPSPLALLSTRRVAKQELELSPGRKARKGRRVRRDANLPARRRRAAASYSIPRAPEGPPLPATSSGGLLSLVRPLVGQG